MIRTRTLTVARVDGREIPASFYVGRCEALRWERRDGGGQGYDGNWAKVPGCDLAFFFRLPARAHHHDVTCPSCGLPLDVTTRRLRAGFLPLTDADVASIMARKGEVVDVSCLAPLAPVSPIDTATDAVLAAEAGAWAALSASSATSPVPVVNTKLVAAEAALKAFDDKPKCRVCWGYNASFKKRDTCGSCHEWGTSADDARGDRSQYVWKRRDLVARVVKAGGVPAESPLGDDVVAAFSAEQDARYQAERAARLARQGAR